MSEFLKSNKEDEKPLTDGQKIIELIFGECKEKDMAMGEEIMLTALFSKSDYILMAEKMRADARTL